MISIPCCSWPRVPTRLCAIVAQQIANSTTSSSRTRMVQISNRSSDLLIEAIVGPESLCRPSRKEKFEEDNLCVSGHHSCHGAATTDCNLTRISPRPANPAHALIDGNSAIVRQALATLHGSFSVDVCIRGNSRHCPFPDDCAQHGNAHVFAQRPP